MYYKDYITQMKGLHGKDPNTVISEITKGTMVGSMIGAGVCVFIGYERNYNLLFSAFVGALIGGIVTRAFIIPKN